MQEMGTNAADKGAGSVPCHDGAVLGAAEDGVRAEETPLRSAQAIEEGMDQLSLNPEGAAAEGATSAGDAKAESGQRHPRLERQVFVGGLPVDVTSTLFRTWADQVFPGHIINAVLVVTSRCLAMSRLCPMSIMTVHGLVRLRASVSPVILLDRRTPRDH